MMRSVRRILAVLLCALLCASPLCAGLAEAPGAPAVEAADAGPLPEEHGNDGNDVPAEAPPATAEATDPAPDQGADVAPSLPDDNQAPGDELPDMGGDAAPGDETPDVDGDAAPGDELSDAQDNRAPDDGTPDAGEAEFPGDDAPDAGGDMPGDEIPDTGDAGTPGDDAPAEGDDAQTGVPDAGDDGGALPAIDFEQDAGHSPAFARGYAELIGDAVVAYDDARPDARAVYLLRDGVVCALSRSVAPLPDRLEVVFDSDGLRVAWIDAAQLRPLSSEQSAAFIERRLTAGDVLFLDEQRTLPLDTPECLLISINTDTIDAAQPEVQPEVAPETAPELQLSVTSLELGVGESGKLTPVFSDGLEHGVTYSTQDSGIATVSADGVVKGVAPGETDIVLTSEFEQVLTVRVTVYRAPTKVNLSAPRTTLGVNEQLQLTATLPEGQSSPLRYSIPNKKETAVATVSESGLVTTYKAGSVTVRVSTYNNRKADIKLTVRAAPTAVALDKAQLTLGIGQGAQLVVSLSPSKAAGAYSFSVAPEGIVSVDPASGELVALSEGSAVVTLETYNHLSATCDVQVMAAPTRLAFPVEAITIGVGESVNLPLSMDEGSAAGLTYDSSNKKTATVKADGTIKGVKAGTAAITVTSHNELTATLAVTVMNAPSKVALKADHTTLGVGESVQLTASLASKAASYARTFISSDDNIVRVDSNGLVTAIGEGTATVKLTCFNKKYGTLKFTVRPAPTEIHIVQQDLKLGVGQTATLTSTITEGSACTYSYSLEAGKESILNLDPQTGAVEALAEGNAVVTVTAHNNVSDTTTITVLPAPDNIELSYSEVTIGVGEKIQAPDVVLPEGTAASLSFASSNKKIATVSADGVIKGVKAGKANITYTTHTGVSAALAVTVVNAPSKVTLKADHTTLGVGEKIQLNVTLPAKTASNQRTFASSDDNIVRVDSNGLVTAIGEGTATVKLTCFNKKYGTLKFTVKPAPAEIHIDQRDLKLGVSQTATLTSTITEGSACTYSYSLEAGKESILNLDPQTGAVEALAEGNAVVTVTAHNGVSDSTTITVLPAPQSLSLSYSEVTIGVGEKIQAPEVVLPEGTAASLSFASSNKKIATVSADGVIKGVKAGKANITYTTHNGVTATLAVTVMNAPSKVTLKADHTTLGVGEKIQLNVTLPNKTASNRRAFSSSDETILQVDGNGVVTAIGEGTATVRMTCFNSKYGTLKFTVKPAPTDIHIEQQNLTLGVSQTTTLTSTITEGSAGTYSYALEVGKDDILKLDAQTGEVEALAVGTAVVTVTAHNKVSDTTAITVLPAPDNIELSYSEVTIGVGEKVQAPDVVFPDGTAASISYKSSNKKIATVSADGVIKGVKAGKADITYTTHTGVTATLAVTVMNAPTKVTLKADHTTLGVGESVQLTASLASKTASYARSFTSSDDNIVQVDGNGLVTAIGEGTATVTMQTFNKKKGSLKFTVVTQPTGISLPEALALGKGEKYTIAATLTPANSGGGMTFSVDDAGVAGVDPATGALEALSPGSTTVRVETYNGRRAECALTVKNAPEGVAFREGNFKLSAGDTYQLLPPVLSGTDPASAGFTYKSANSKILTVSSTGLVRAVKAGKAKLTVTTFNKQSASITITVVAAPKSIAFAETEHRLLIHDSFVPEVSFANSVAGSYTLESSDPGIAAVEGTSVRGVAGGQVTLTATSFNGKQATMRVNVPFLPDSIWPEPATVVLGEGDSDTLTVHAPEGQGALMTYSIDDPNIASYEQVDNETLTVRAVSMGETTIRMRSDNGLAAQARVRVMRSPTLLRLFPSRTRCSIDERQLQLTWEFGSDEEGGSMRFTSSDESVATVSSTGLVSFLATGTVRIGAETYNGHSAQCELEIGEYPGRMYFEQPEYKLALGDSVRLDAAFDSGCESYTLRSADETIVSTDGDMMRGVAPGSTTVTAVGRLTGQQASCTVTVVPAPEGIEFEKAELELVVGLNSSARLNARCLPDGVGSVIYSTSDPAVATVDSASGVVTAKGKGECTIYAASYDGRHTAECAVRVSFLLEGVRIGIDPGHQAKGNLEKERVSPNSSRTKNKCAYPSSGVAHVREDVIDLQISLKLRDALKKLGAEVYLTRETANVDISNRERALMMNELGVDFALRIHANSWTDGSAQGLSIIRRKSCAYPADEVDGAAVMAAEKQLGTEIARYFKQETGCKWRGLGTSNDYTMNNWCTMPCLLIEVGFMTNPVEGMNIVKPEYQDKMVKGMVEGICAYRGIELPTEW